MRISRRTFIAGATTAVALGKPAIIHASEPLVVAGYGGEFGELYKTHIVQPFEQKFNVKVVFDESGLAYVHYAKLRAGKGDGGFDVAAEFVPELILLGEQEKLLAPITEKEVPNLKYTWPAVSANLPPYFAVRNVINSVLMYHKDKVEKPESWMDFWEAEKKYGPDIKGRIASHGLQNYPLLLYPLIMGARARGGSDRDLAPGWELLKAQKPILGPVLSSSAAAVPYMENEQLWMLPYWSSRAGYYVDRGFPYAVSYPKDGTIALPLLSAIAAGSRNKELAYEFVNFTLEKSVQRAFSLAFSSGPARGDITDWPAEFAQKHVTTDEAMASTSFIDEAYFLTQKEKITETWQDIMA